MSLFARTALGLEICRDGLKFSLVSRQNDTMRLDAYAVAPLPADLVRFGQREPNILEPSAFVTQVRAAWLRLLTKTTRVAVALPDAVGRTLLLELDTRFKSHEEGAEIIRWKLKKSSSLDIHDTHLAYQIVGTSEEGAMTALVSLVAKPVLSQYEGLLVEAGLEPYAIEFIPFSLYRLFSGRIELSDASVVVTCHGGSLGVMIFHGGNLEFFRAKEFSGATIDANRLFQELNSSLLVYREKQPGREPGAAFCNTAETIQDVVRDVTAEATGLEPLVLEPDRFIKSASGVTVDRSTAYLLAASVGAAMRAF